MSEEKVKNDDALDKWFREHPGAETTVMRCEKCGLHYRPILGHKCKAKRKGAVRYEHKRRTDQEPSL